MYEKITEACRAAKGAEFAMAAASTEEKNRMLAVVADSLIAGSAEIVAANKIDVADARAAGRPEQFIDRLRLDEARIKVMARDVTDVIALPDPVGWVLDNWTADRNGLEIQKRSVPLGTIGIIYEARPNVTSDCVALCIKSGNCVVLRGSKDGINSNRVIVRLIRDALKGAGCTYECVQLVDDVTREGTEFLMRQNEFLSVLIPRGSAALIQSVVKNATVPVIETGTGNCHIYVERSGDVDMAISILLNAKCSRPSVCNAAESLLIDRAVVGAELPRILNALVGAGVQIRGCGETLAIADKAGIAATAAAEEDFYAEYGDYIISVKVVEDYAEAVAHINKYGTHHSDAIITRDPDAEEYFLNGVDSAAVYVNASTRFTDGSEFGFGAEMGISTQKLHARGPVGLKELTSYKYCVRGNGQTR